MTIRLLELSGSHGAIGAKHGASHAEEIQHYADERLSLVMSGLWSGHKLGRGEVMDIAASCLVHHEEFSPDLTEEMLAIGSAARLSPEEMIIVGGFTDFVDAVRATTGGDLPPEVIEDDCTAFIVPDHRSSGAGYFGQTWDMHDTATQFVVLTDIRVDNKPRAMVFTTTGCVGQIGMNEAGVAVGINNLHGASGKPGVTWPLVVRKALEQTTAEGAKDIIMNANLAGAHNYLILDAHGSGYNIEAMASTNVVFELDHEVLIHTNHTLVPESTAVEVPRPAELQASSVRRLEKATELLSDGEITEETLMEVTRDEEAICQIAHDPYHVESCGAAIMRPQTGDFWAVWGLPNQNDYEHFSMGAV